MKNGLQVDERGTKCWYLNGLLHREDGPAMIFANGTKFWFLNNKRHREDGPAAEYPDDTNIWYLNDDCLGEGDEGFWALWKLLTDEQRNCLNLHMHLPGLKVSCKKNPAGV
jgi:hypothetical protein